MVQTSNIKCVKNQPKMTSNMAYVVLPPYCTAREEHRWILPAFIFIKMWKENVLWNGSWQRCHRFVVLRNNLCSVHIYAQSHTQLFHWPLTGLKICLQMSKKNCLKSLKQFLQAGWVHLTPRPNLQH